MVHVILKLKYTLSLFPFFLPLLPFKNRHVSIFLFSIYIYSFSSQRIEKESKQNRELDASRLPNICLPMRTIPPLLCVDEEKRNVSYSTTNALSTVHTRIVSASLSLVKRNFAKDSHFAQWRCYYYMALELLLFQPLWSNTGPRTRRDCARE